MQPGATFNHYRIVSRLGAGGMGEVFLAEDTRLRRKVALKILLPEVAEDPTRLARFQQEARLASALSHPNAAHIYEIGEASIGNGTRAHYMAMEYVEGETLESRMGTEPMPVPEIVSLAAQIADALSAAHSRGIVHRDIKPANLMVDARGHVKILDFGLAKYIPEKPDGAVTNSQIATQFLTSSGVVLGTVSFMSPEQALGRLVDHRSDLFSLGVVLHRMATGRLPFAGSTSSETLARILQEPPDALNEVPPELERVIGRCLEKDRDKRYQSAAEVLSELRAVAAGTAPRNEGSRSNGPLRAILIDDEELARALLREYLNGAGVEVIAECANGFEAVKAIADRKPDLVFLDVQMPKLDGFEVLELIDPDVAVIFVTAYDQYAMRAFDAHAVDYLLKPFAPDRFKKALERARLRLGESRHTPRPRAAELSAAARPPDQKLERIVVKDGAKVHIIPIDKLDYIEAQDDYIALRSEKKNYLKQQTISSIETQLDPKRFVRIHRSYIVNLERIARIEPYTKDSRVAVLTDGTQLPVSRSGHTKLKQMLGDNV
jgi:two-component system LytT family response regulator